MNYYANGVPSRATRLIRVTPEGQGQRWTSRGWADDQDARDEALYSGEFDWVSEADANTIVANIQAWVDSLRS